MPAPGEYKTVQSRILKYAQQIGWMVVLQGEAEARRGFKPNGSSPAERASEASLYFN
jgi:type I restriction enzyme R subunit